MNFAQYRKTLKLKTIDTLYIDYNTIKVQYNPDLFKYWKKVCGDSMEINSTPYYHYLKYRKIDKYQELMRLYGRPDVWTLNNINKFFALCRSVKKEGVKELPIVLNRPILPNPYNKGISVWEGHRRLSICLYKGIKTKVKLCKLVNQKPFK